ncbi:MAG: hypothetical protein QOH04_1000 [Sphingomonadales bacterium]|jgi:glutathione synthase/RimK-type ligase-like ATP-grasp enzyme|nr:hypothetical protein [Sphingomonadales bacterium]
MIADEIVIFTRCGDLHAVAVAAALDHKGHPPLLWYSSDYPQRQTYSIYIPGNGFCCEIRRQDRDVVIERARSFWFRRAFAPLPDYSKLHPDDHGYARKASSVYHQSFRALLDHETVGLKASLWANRPINAVSAESKPLQLSLATRLGWPVPDTLISNDPLRVREFIRAHGGRAVHKSLGSYWWQEEDALAFANTSVVDEEGLPNDGVLRQTAEIYQELVEKKREIRALFFGRTCLAVEIDPGDRGADHVDWRVFYEPSETSIRPCELPENISSACFEMMAQLGLSTASFDLMVDKEGRFIFSELNQAGQFLWLEAYGVPALEAFSEFLISGDPNFVWQPTKQPLRAQEIYDSARLKDLLAEESFRYRTPDGVVGGINGRPVPAHGGNYG